MTNILPLPQELRPALPTIEGNVDYSEYRRQLPATDPRNADAAFPGGKRPEGTPDVGLSQLGQARTWDVTSDAQRGKPGALQWDPGTLNMDIKDIKAKYDPDLWASFETSMRTHQIPELGTSAWDWVTRNTPQWTDTVNAKTRTSVINRIEADLRRRESGEVAMAVGPDGANFVLVKSSTQDIPYDPVAVAKMEGMTVIHNHPMSSSFSDTDLFTFVRSGATEFRIASPARTYILKPTDPNFAGLSEPDRRAYWESVVQPRMMAIHEQERKALVPMIQALGEDVALSNLWPNIVKTLAEEFGWTYTIQEGPR